MPLGRQTAMIWQEMFTHAHNRHFCCDQPDGLPATATGLVGQFIDCCVVYWKWCSAHCVTTVFVWVTPVFAFVSVMWMLYPRLSFASHRKTPVSV